MSARVAFYKLFHCHPHPIGLGQCDPGSTPAVLRLESENHCNLDLVLVVRLYSMVEAIEGAERAGLFLDRPVTLPKASLGHFVPKTLVVRF